MPAIEQSETGGCRYLIAEFMRGGTEEKRILYACRHGEWEIVFASFEGVESEITLAFSPSSKHDRLYGSRENSPLMQHGT